MFNKIYGQRVTLTRVIEMQSGDYQSNGRKLYFTATEWSHKTTLGLHGFFFFFYQNTITIKGKTVILFSKNKNKQTNKYE